MKFSLFQRLLREPLIHFLLIGGVLFIIYYQVSDPVIEDNRIEISKADLELFATNWIRRTGQPPNSQQIDAQIKQHIREQVLYREALKLGLEQNDVLIRRRLARKMQFLFEDLSPIPEPADTELVAYMTQHADRFTDPVSLSFKHIFLDPDKRGDALENDAEKLLIRLQQKKQVDDIHLLGDRTMQPYQFEKRNKRQLRSQFGDDFAEKIFTLPVKQWIGPITSGFGEHLVYISSRKERLLPSLEKIRSKVIHEWHIAKRKEANDLFYQSLQQHYEIVLDEDVIKEAMSGHDMVDATNIKEN